MIAAPSWRVEACAQCVSTDQPEYTPTPAVERKQRGTSVLPAVFDARRTGRPVKLCIQVEGAELVLRDFVLSGPDP